MEDDFRFDKASGHGATLKKRYNVIKAAAYSVAAGRIANWAHDDEDIVYVSPDRPVNGALDISTQAIGADMARLFGYDGTGIGVAVIDSGITFNNDLKNSNGASRVIYSENFVADGTTNTGDPYGHGTHVAGIIGSSASNSLCSTCHVALYGVAANVNIINLRVFNQIGVGTDSAVIGAIQRAVALKSTYNTRVINLSLGRAIFESYKTDPLTQAVENAWKAGIVVVVAAGNYGRDNSNNNNGYGSITSPGNKLPNQFSGSAGSRRLIESAYRRASTSSRETPPLRQYCSAIATKLLHEFGPWIVGHLCLLRLYFDSASIARRHAELSEQFVHLRDFADDLRNSVSSSASEIHD